MKRLAILVVLLAVLVSVAVAQETTDRPPITIDNAPQVRSIETLDGHLTQVMSTDFSADGTVLATGALDRTIKVWDMVAVEPITVIDQNLERVWHISLNADGTRVASVHRGGSAYVWDAQTGGQLLHLQGHIGNVQAVTFSVDDTRLYTGGADLSLRVWDAQTGEMLHVFDNLGFESLRSPLDIQPISDSQVAIATGELAGGMSKMDHPEGCVVMVVNVDDGTVASQIDGVPCSIWNVAILPEQELIAFGDGRGMVHIVDLATAETIQRLDSNPLGIRR
ncbi:MAG: hypothetical protein GYB66_10220, partial [Chloroflexi bacterium]|nr:hypothetical protein [Chloroflexota bacterium]